ncbi:hypothetical protein AN958_02330, partial [Leucoagaricus sp. SymC.cos]
VQPTKAQELTAVSGFLASLPQNQIPSFVDPSTPIDPQLVLDFDARSPRAHQEVQAMVQDVWSRNSVFPYSRVMLFFSFAQCKSLLNSLRLKPAPTIIDVDMRDDADVLIPMLLGAIQEIHQMEHDGTLRQMIAESGAIINGPVGRHSQKVPSSLLLKSSGVRDFRIRQSLVSSTKIREWAF